MTESIVQYIFEPGKNVKIGIIIQDIVIVYAWDGINFAHKNVGIQSKLFFQRLLISAIEKPVFWPE